MLGLGLALVLLGPAEATTPTVAPEPASEPARARASELPRQGSGRLVAGPIAMALGGATVVIAVRGSDPKDLTPAPGELTSTLAAIGAISIVAGTVSLISGGLARSNFNRWSASTGTTVREDGTGLIAGGAVLTGFGVATMVTFGALAGIESGGSVDYPYNETLMLGIGGLVTAAGLGFGSWGIVRNRRYRGWRDATFASVPVVAPSRRGVSFGVAGRF